MLLKNQSTTEQQTWRTRASIWLKEQLPKVQTARAWSEIPSPVLSPAKELALCVIGGFDLVRDINRGAYRAVPWRAVANLAGMLTQGIKWCDSHGVTVVPRISTNKRTQQKRESEILNTKVSSKHHEETPSTETRAEHISEYMHMLPDEIKEQTSTLKEKYLELSDLRSASEHAATDEERAEYANRALTCDQQLRQLFLVIDMCVDYYEKNGIVISLSELHANQRPSSEQQATIPGFAATAKEPAKWTKEEIDAIEDPAQQEYFKGIRIKANQRYLRRLPGEKGAPMLTPDWVDEVRIRVKELKEWGESTSGKIAKAIELANLNSNN